MFSPILSFKCCLSGFLFRSPCGHMQYIPHHPSRTPLGAYKHSWLKRTPRGVLRGRLVISPQNKIKNTSGRKVPGLLASFSVRGIHNTKTLCRGTLALESTMSVSNDIYENHPRSRRRTIEEACAIRLRGVKPVRRQKGPGETRVPRWCSISS